ncbi:MAG: phosphotransferase [Clostridia bacterium]|nr:phosphotransferase [Clostridia bacterium]
MTFKLDNLIYKGETKEVFKEDGNAIKLFNETHPKAFVLNEALNHARVEQYSGLSVPTLKEVAVVNNRWALVYNYLEGKTLAELMAENPEKEDEYLNKFVDIQLEVLSKNVPLLNRTKDKFRRKLSELTEIADDVKYELMQRLEGMKNHTKLCHGDFDPSNIIFDKDGNYYVIDWAHVTAGNASADAARTFLIFSIENKTELANKYLKLFSQKSEIEIKYIQSWIPIVAATQLEKGVQSEKEFLLKWINVAEYQ